MAVDQIKGVTFFLKATLISIQIFALFFRFLGFVKKSSPPDSPFTEDCFLRSSLIESYVDFLKVSGQCFFFQVARENRKCFLTRTAIGRRFLFSMPTAPNASILCLVAMFWRQKIIFKLFRIWIAF